MEQEIVDERQGFIDWLVSKGLKDRSIEDYIYYYDKFGGAFNLSQVNADRFITKYNNPIVRAFINNYKTFLLQYGQHYFPQLNLEIIGNIILARITGRKAVRLPNVLSEGQVLEIEKQMNCERDKLMLLISFYGGLRLGGLLNIKPYDFLWNEWDESERQIGKLKVNEKGDKERIVFMPRSIMERIERWMREVAVKKDPNPSNPIFKGWVKRLSERRWQTILQKASIKAVGFSVNPHLLRHSCATWLLTNGWKIEEIKEYLGHESIVTTQIYTHIVMNDLQSKYQSISDKEKIS